MINSKVPPKKKIVICDIALPSDEEVIQFMEKQFIYNSHYR
jgi:hypothetical protein